MPKEVLRPLGLFTNANPHSDSPPGALRTATNVVIRKKGVAEPRPGFEANAVSAAENESRAQFSYDGEVFNVSTDGAGTWGFRRVTTSSVDVTGFARPTDDSVCQTKAAEMRGNLYVATDEGVKKITSGSATAFLPAGVKRPAIADADHSSTGTWLADGDSVVYKVLLRKEDSNELVTRSAPSGLAFVKNDSGGTEGATITVVLADDAVIGDQLEIYRSLASSTEAPNAADLFFAGSVELTAADITDTSLAYVDTLPEANLGAALYTNAGEQGSTQENNLPPACSDLAEFRNSLFFANTRVQHRHTFDQVELMIPNSTTGDVAAGTTITNVADTSNMRVGQYITDTAGADYGSAGTYFPAETKITDINGTTVTVDKTLLGTTTALSISFGDVLTIDGTDIAASAAQRVGPPLMFPDESADPELYPQRISDVWNNEQALALAQIDHYVHVLDYFPGTFLVERNDLADTLFDVSSSIGTNFQPNLSSAQASDNDRRKNRLCWSKPLQPEHVPLENFVDIGRQDASILRIVPTRDALFVLKEDGVWRLTGAGADSGWRVDPFDPTLKLLCPEAAVQFEGLIFAWTNRGVLAIGDGGIQNLSDDYIGNDLEERQNRFATYPGDLRSCWATASEERREIYFAFPTDTAQDVSDGIYVLNLSSKAWTFWDLDRAAGLYDRGTGALWMADATAGVYSELNTFGGDVNYGDADGTETASVVDTVVTLSGAWAAGAVGDCCVDSAGDVYIVQTVNSTTEFVVDRAGLTAGVVDLYLAYECDLEFIARAEGDPTALKVYMENSFAFSLLRRATAATVVYDSDSANAAVTAEKTVTFSEAGKEFTLRTYVPRNHAYATLFYPRIKINQAQSRWELAGVSLVFRPVSDRIGGRAE